VLNEIARKWSKFSEREFSVGRAADRTPTEFRS